MSTVTLGGERLGSGKKMKVDLHGFERSTHDLSYVMRTTASPGTLIPFMKELALPGDTFDIDLDLEVMTQPTVGPLLGTFKCQLDVFVVPIRLYHSALHNNQLGIGLKMNSIKLPKISLPVFALDSKSLQDVDNAHTSPSSLLAYLDIRGAGIPTTDDTDLRDRKFNAVPYLAMFDIYKQYYSNKQEEEGVIIHNSRNIATDTITSFQRGAGNIQAYPLGTVLSQSGPKLKVTLQTANLNWDPGTVLIRFWGSNQVYNLKAITAEPWFSTTGAQWESELLPQYVTSQIYNYEPVTNTSEDATGIELVRFPLETIDEMRQYILASPPNQEVVVNNTALQPYILPLQRNGTSPNVWVSSRYNQEGLLVKTYQSDLFNNWLSTEWLDGPGGVNEITAVDTSGGSFNIDSLNLAKKVYDMLNRIAVSGGTYDDWLSAVYDHESYTRAESPVYMGGMIKELLFQEIISTAETTTDPLGKLAGRGVLGRDQKGGKVHIKVDEPSYVMGIFSLTPRIDYSQGNKWDTTLDTLDDLHKPNLDGIGFQELIAEQQAWWTTKQDNTGKFTQRSGGKQPAWINYMTNVNKVRGNFAVASNSMFMTLNRKYEPQFDADGSMKIQDYTTYIDPEKYNNIFAQTELDAQNFWVQIACDIIARRKMSAKVIPNL